MSELHLLTVAEAARMIRDRTLSAVELMEALLERCQTLEPDLRVWVTLDEDAALETARTRDRELAAEGPRGPLHGVPIGVKDIYYTQGVLTTACSRILADFVPDYDATSVSMLKTGRGGYHGQDRDHRVRVRRPVSHSQPVEHGAHAWRVELRFGGWSRGRDVSRGPRLPDRRLDTEARGVQRGRRTQAHVRQDQ